jgi:3-hydroxyisobutyrate dehydrogenase
MAGHLLAAGHSLHVFNRTQAKAEPLIEQGALWHDAPGDVAAASDVVITMVGLPTDVEEVYFGGTAAVPTGQGVIDRARDGAVLIDMTTSSPMLAERIAAAAITRRLAALDAPVSGGDVGARNAALVIMAGGAREAFAHVRPILGLVGKSVTHLGPAGAGIRLVLDSRAPSPFFPILRHLPCGAMMRLPIKEATWTLLNGSMAIGAGSRV